MLVHQILKSKASADVVTVRSGTRVAEAARHLAERRIGTVIVSDDGVTALGILSERDIVRELARSGGACLDRSVDDYMTRDLVTCTAQMDADAVMKTMTDGHFRHMPVVNDGKLVGLITLGDVVKAQLAELAMEKSALEGMIMGH
ncbi:MAG: CBS domain-containing protein [Proteobacteria bacterium]|nr:CBS domain-containing protein [Pseudomonadota bacterium]